MTKKNILVGERSKLTSAIIKKIDDVEVISSSNYNKIKFNNIKKNYIFNNFYPSFKLNTLKPSQYDEFLQLSLVNLIKILKNLSNKNTNKIIYTSSSSVYSLDEKLNSIDLDKYNRKIYASLKYSAERIVENYCRKNKIKFYIMRLFNTYGDESDKFSLIEKLINIKKNNLELNLINDGISIRDFVHLDDVALIYKKILENKSESGTYDVGTGKGVLIKNLINFINIDNSKIIKSNNINEITRSIADTRNLKKNIGNYNFKSLENYLRRRIQISKKNKIFFSKEDFTKVKYDGSIIYGAGFAGEKLYLELKKKNEKIVFFVDDDPIKQNHLFNNVPVISFKDMMNIIKKKTINRIYVAIPSLNKEKIIEINKKLSQFFFDIRYLPEKKYLINSLINLNDLKINQINSILKREPINLKKIKYLKNKNILVTGAAGSIGFELCRQLVYQNVNKIIGLDNSEISIYEKKSQIDKKVQLLLCDINDFVLLDQIVKQNKIDLIIHAAAYKHVNILEKNIYSSIKNNIFGTKNVCEVALKNNSNLVLISTDKAAEPKSILGYTKKISEQLIHYYNLQNKKNFFNIVRFGNVFGSSGSAVIKFIDQINNNKPVTITNKSASRFFMTILEACYLVLKTTSLSIKNKTFILNMGNPINIYNLAKKLGEFKKNLDNSYKIKFAEIGLQKNEKLHEKLSEKNESLKKINKDIFYVSNYRLKFKKFNDLFINFEKNYKFLSERKIVGYLKIISNL